MVGKNNHSRIWPTETQIEKYGIYSIKLGRDFVRIHSYYNFDCHVTPTVSRNRNMERRRKNSRIFGSKSTLSPLPVIIEKVTVSPQRVQKIPSRFGTSYYLSREDVEFLRKNTNYSAKDIKIWFRWDCMHRKLYVCIY